MKPYALTTTGRASIIVVAGEYRRVYFEGREIARFDADDESHARDFCNGFNTGLREARRVR